MGTKRLAGDFEKTQLLMAAELKAIGRAEELQKAAIGANEEARQQIKLVKETAQAFFNAILALAQKDIATIGGGNPDLN